MLRHRSKRLDIASKEDELAAREAAVAAREADVAARERYAEQQMHVAELSIRSLGHIVDGLRNELAAERQRYAELETDYREVNTTCNTLIHEALTNSASRVTQPAAPLPAVLSGHARGGPRLRPRSLSPSLTVVPTRECQDG